MQNETSRVKRGFGSEVELHLYDKQTNKCTFAKCVFVENCPLQGYYAASTVKNTGCLVTQKSAFLIYFTTEASDRAFVGLLFECATVFSARISSNVNYKPYTRQCKIFVLKETSKNIFSSTNDINFTTGEKIIVI